MKILNIFLITFLISFSTLFAQSSNKNEVEYSNDIEGQFDKLYEKSNNYKDFKVVNRTLFQNLKKNTIDSISSLKKEIKGNDSIISKQKEKIEELNQSITITNTKLSKTNQEKEMISFIGIPFTKDGFKKIFCFTLLGLLILLAVFIFKHQKSLKDTKLAVANLKDLENEYEDHRRRALEREQIVMRKLQDEINKHKK